MSFNTSPGVYTRELDQSFRANPVSGNVGGIVLTASRGPLDVTLVSSERDFIRIYGEPSLDNPSMYAALSFVQKVGGMNVKRVIVDATASTGIYTPVSDDLLTFTAASPGVWGDSVVVSFAEYTDDADLFYIDITDGSVKERFLVSLDPTKRDGFGNSVYIEDVLNVRSFLTTVDHDVTITDPIDLAETVELTGGTDDTTPVSDSEVILGWADFDQVETVSVDYLINAGFTEAAVHGTMVSLAESRKDCFAVLDTTDLTNAADIESYRKTTSNQNSSYAAYYAGWIDIFDAYTGRNVSIPPSGHVAAVFALTQTNYNPWDAPAGLQRGVISGAGVRGVSKIWSEAERDLFYTAQINPIQQFPGTGIVIWGQKTAVTAISAFNRINTRLLFSYVRSSLKVALRPFVFQANTAFTRSSVQSLCFNFMEDIRNNQGVTDFRVVVEEINTPQVIDSNQLLVEVWIKPTAYTEFIRLDTIAIPTGQDF